MFEQKTKLFNAAFYNLLIYSLFIYWRIYFLICLFNVQVESKQYIKSPGVFCKKGVLKNFAFLQDSTRARVSFQIKKNGFLLKNWLNHRRFLVNFPKFLRAQLLQNNSGRLVLDIVLKLYYGSHSSNHMSLNFESLTLNVMNWHTMSQTSALRNYVAKCGS